MQLVVDWDGTVTEGDTLHAVIARFGDLDVFHAMEAEIGRRLTLNEVIAIEMATVTAPLDDVVRYLLETVRLRPGFAEPAEHRDPLVVSAGFHELIDPLLERDGIQVRVIANNVTGDPAGWRTDFADLAPCEVCGEACKRVVLGDLDGFAFAGDGVSDRCVSLAASRLFARDGLAAWLDAQGVAYEPFADFYELEAALR